LHVAQRHPGIQGGSDERVTQRVRADVLGDSGAARDAADDSRRAVPVQAAPVSDQEDRPVRAFSGGQVDRPGSARRQRNGDNLAAYG